jgi:threonine/homoserine/homoserine lactone efflux protein
MPDLQTLMVFCLAALALVVVPGPAVLYIITRSIDQGRKAGIVSVLGIASGALVHVVAATLGLSALLMSSALAFSAVKYLGAAYLIYLGIRKLRERDRPGELSAVQIQPLGRVFADGILVSVFNPKAALFFFAFLPQFIDVSRGDAAPQMLLFGTAFIAIALTSDTTYALLAARLGDLVRGNPAVARIQRLCSGGIYLTLGAATALTGSRASAR